MCNVLIMYPILTYGIYQVENVDELVAKLKESGFTAV
jgi:hypothetical protein